MSCRYLSWVAKEDDAIASKKSKKIFNSSGMSLDFLDNDDWEPAAGEHPTWSMEEIENHPLFMTEASEISNNHHIEALQSVLYDDDSPHSICHNFKEQGNSALSRGLLEDAEIFYRRALDVSCDDVPLLAQVHSNLALVLLKQRKFPECVDECYRAIGLDSSCIKAFYRGALASFELGLYSQGTYFAAGGLEVEKDNEPLLAVNGRLAEAKRRQEEAKSAASQAVSDKPRPKYRWRD